MKILFYPMLPDFRKSTAFWKSSQDSPICPAGMIGFGVFVGSKRCQARYLVQSTYNSTIVILHVNVIRLAHICI
jgi:hypothetical protein